MPRYLFHFTDGHTVATDNEGADFADDTAARVEAVESARDLMGASDGSGRCRRHWRVIVESDVGQELFSVPFMHALEPDLLARGGLL